MAESTDGRGRRPRAGRLAVLAYAALTIVFLWPWPLAPGSIVRDAPIHTDSYLFSWNAWWLLQWAGSPFTSLFACDRLFYPGGCDLAFHTLSPLSAIPSAIGGAICGVPDGFMIGQTVRIMASFVLAAWAAFRLARRWLGAGPAFVCGLVFSFSSYHLNEAPRLHLVGLEYLPLLFLVVLRLLDRPTWRRTSAVAFVTGAAFWDAPDYCLYGLLFAAPMVVWGLVGPGHGGLRGRWRRIGMLSAAVLGSVVLTFPLLLARLDAFRAPAVSRGATERFHFSLDPLDFVWPDRHHALYGTLVDRPVGTPVYEEARTSLFCGFLPLLLIVIGVVVRRRPPRIVWSLGLLAAVALAAGERAAFGSAASPHGVLESFVPFLSASRTPVRFLAVAWLFLALLAAQGVTALRGRGVVGSAGVIIAGGLLFVEQWRVPLSLESVDVPPPYGTLADMPRAAVLNIPLETVNHDHLGQMLHGMPLIAGNIPRADHGALAAAFRTPVLSRWLGGRPSGADAETLKRTGDALVQFGVPYVTLNTTLLRLKPGADDHGALVAELLQSGFLVAGRDERVILFAHSSIARPR